MPLFGMIYRQFRDNAFHVHCPLRVQLNLWKTDEKENCQLNRGEQPSRLSISLVNWTVKFVPKSDDTYEDYPVNCLAPASSNTSQTAFAVKDFNV